MAELRNFPIEQSANTNAIKSLAKEEAGEVDRLKETIKKSQDAKPQSIEDHVEITPDALKKSGALEQSRGVSQSSALRTNRLTEKRFAQDGSQAQSVTEQRRDVSKALKEGYETGATQVQPVAVDRVKATSPDQVKSESKAAVEAGFTIGNTQTDPTVTQKFGTRNQDNGAAAPTVVQQRLETKEALEGKGKNDATAIETERGQNVSKMI